MSNKKRPPLYARIGSDGCVMKYIKDQNNYWSRGTPIYWRPAGQWYCHIRQRNDKFYSHIPEHPNIHNIEIVAATKKEYEKCNDGYLFL